MRKYERLWAKGVVPGTSGSVIGFSWSTRPWNAPERASRAAENIAVKVDDSLKISEHLVGSCDQLSHPTRGGHCAWLLENPMNWWRSISGNLLNFAKYFLKLPNKTSGNAEGRFILTLRNVLYTSQKRREHKILEGAKYFDFKEQ